MKMARASANDIQAAMNVCSALESIDGHMFSYMPQDIQNNPDGEQFDLDDAKQCRRVLEYLISQFESASPFRVVGGAAIMLNPDNKLVDPDSDTIDHHPRTVHALDALQRIADPDSGLTIEQARELAASLLDAKDTEQLNERARKLKQAALDSASAHFITTLAGSASSVAGRYNTGAMEMAGLVVSWLAMDPSRIAPFLAGGPDWIIEAFRTLKQEDGALTWYDANARVRHPSEFRKTS